MIIREQETTPVEQPLTSKADDELPPPDIIYVLDGAEPEQAQLGVIIRAEKPADRAAIEVLLNKSTASRISSAEHEANAPGFALIAEQYGELVGYIAASQNSHRRWYTLHSLNVLAEKQCLGIGTQLVRHALAQLRHLDAAGCTAIGNRHFLSRLGFVEESTSGRTDTSTPPSQIMIFTELAPAAEITILNALLPSDPLGL